MKNYSTPQEFFDALKDAWSIETSSSWTRQNPAKGQCSVTSLVFHDVFGGEILKTRTAGGTHFYNRIGSVNWDMTVSQFDRPIPFEDLPASRDEAFADTSPHQYQALKSRL
ncbi:MAG: YunG family protein [Rhizobiaceae bacterium]